MLSVVVFLSLCSNYSLLLSLLSVLLVLDHVAICTALIVRQQWSLNAYGPGWPSFHRDNTLHSPSSPTVVSWLGLVEFHTWRWLWTSRHILLTSRSHSRLLSFLPQCNISSRLLVCSWLPCIDVWFLLQFFSSMNLLQYQFPSDPEIFPTPLSRWLASYSLDLGM